MRTSTLFGQDINVLHQSLKIRLGEVFVELGADQGGTSELNINFLIGFMSCFTYYGVDKTPQPLLNHPNYKFIQGDFHSEEVLTAIPSRIDWLFIDGCHCRDCVLKDAYTFIPRVVIGGVVCFHDATPIMDTTRAFPPCHGTAPQYIQVHQALKELDLTKLKLHLYSAALPQQLGGVQVYIKNPPSLL